jgi:phospholipid/cholesterol/gamma-HCH transport system substrate-binding protein
VPSRSELKWSQLKVGIVVVIAAAILLVVVFAMTGEMGLFQHKIKIVTYVSDAGSLLTGAVVNLQGVRIGTVTSVRLIENPPDPHLPIRIDMSVSDKYTRWLRTDSLVQLGTPNPLGAMEVDISYGTLNAPPATNGTVLRAEVGTGITALLVSTHSLLQNLNDIVQKVGSIVDQITNGQGSIGKLIYSEELYNRFNDIAASVQTITNGINQGRGTIGQLISNDELYRKLNETLDNTNALVAQIENGNGSLTKFIKDPQIYDNANAIVANLKQTTADLNAGKGPAGELLKDQEMAAKIKDTVNRLNELLAAVQAGKGTVGKLMNDPTLYNNVNGLTLQFQDFMKDFRLHPKRYLTIQLRIF